MARMPTIIAALAWTIFFSASPAWARRVSSVAATATAVVVEKLTVTGRKPLDFGFVMPSLRGGTVTISPENRRTETGDVRVSSLFSRAEFAIRGIPGHNYTILAPDSLIFTVRNREGKKWRKPHQIRELTVTNFIAYSPTLGATGFEGRLNQKGEDNAYLGATLIVPADAAPGIYSGWVPITVSY